MSGLDKGLETVDVVLEWDPRSPADAPPHDLDLVAAAYAADAPYGAPACLVHFGSRDPDGCVTLRHDSRTEQNFGVDDTLTLELHRMSEAYGRVVVGVAIQQRYGPLVFGQVASPSIRLSEAGEELVRDDFAGVGDATAATVVECVRGPSGAWQLRPLRRGFTVADLDAFAETMGSLPSSGD